MFLLPAVSRPRIKMLFQLPLYVHIFLRVDWFLSLAGDDRPQLRIFAVEVGPLSTVVITILKFAANTIFSDQITRELQIFRYFSFALVKSVSAYPLTTSHAYFHETGVPSQSRYPEYEER